MLATIVVMAAAAALLPVAAAVGKLAKTQAVNITVGMVAMGLAVVAIGATAWVIAKILGNVPASALLKAIPVVIATTLAFAAAGALLLGAAVVGAVAMGGGAVFMLAGMAAMALAVIAIGATAWVLAQILGPIPAADLAKSVVAAYAMLPAFAAAGLLLLEAAVVGAIILTGIGAAAMVAGMAAMALALIAIAGTATVIVEMIAPLDIGSIVKAGTVMTLMIPAFLAAGAVLGVAGLVGAAIIATLGVGAAAMIIGMEAIDAGLQKIAETAVKMTELLGGLNLGQVAQTVGIMAVMSVAFVAVGALVLAAGVIGAGILATLGLGAKAIETGMQTITDAVGILSGTVIGIMKQLNEMNVDPAELKGKAEAFGAVLSGVSGLMASVAIILGNMPFSMLDDEAETRIKMEGVQKFMTDLIGVRGGGGVIGIIETITNSLKEIPADKVESAKAIGGILSAVSNLVGSLAGPAMEVIKQSSEGWFTTAKEESKKAKEGLEGVTNFIGDIMGKAGTLVTTIANALKELKPEQAAALEKGGGAIAGILGAIGKLMEATKPPKVEVKNLDLKKFSGSFTVAAPNIEGMFDALKDKLPGIITALVQVIQGVPMDKSFIDKLGAVKNIFEFIGKMTETMKFTKDIKPEKPNQSALEAMLEPIELMGSFFNALAGKRKGFFGITFTSKSPLKDLVDAIIGAAKAMGSEKDVKTSITKAKMISEMLSSIASMMESLSKIKKGGADFDPKKLAEAVATSATAMKEMKEPLSNLAKAIGDVKIDEAQGKTATTKAKAIDEVLKSVKTIDEATYAVMLPLTGMYLTAAFLNLATAPGTGVMDQVLKGCEAISNSFTNFKIGATTQATAVVKAVKDMVKAVQEMDDALSKVPDVDISTRLTKFAGQMGVGSQGIYTVKSKEVVVTVNLKVTMDAGTLEKTIIENSKSIIRDRINFLLDDKGIESTNKTTAKISENYGQSRAPTLTP
jgi:hypothetical protein